MNVVRLSICFGCTLGSVSALACDSEEMPHPGSESTPSSQELTSEAAPGTSASPLPSAVSSVVNTTSAHAERDAGVGLSPSSPLGPTQSDGVSERPSSSVQLSGFDSGDGSTGPTQSSDTSDANDPSAELYDPLRLPRFDIELSPDALDTLSLVTGQDDPRQDTYVSADLHYEDETISNVGLRIKGEGSFQQLDAKPAWKLKFDEFVPDQTFRGLKRLTLNNLFEDPSFIAERLAYDVYRAAGLPAPRCNSALVYVNGEFYGVYANVESEDKPFLRRWFDDASGNLYEEGQSDFVPGAETAFNLETNEETNDRSDLVNLIAAVSDATNPETFLDNVGTYLDIDNYLRFTAVEAAVNQWDMYSYTVFWVNNLRLYNDPATGKFHFIPWGHDMSMKPYRDSGKPYVHLFELARQYDQANGDVTSGLLLQRCLESESCVAAYGNAVEEVISVYSGLELETRANTYYEQIKSAVYEDQRKRVCCGSDSLSNQDFEAAYTSVVETIRGRVAALKPTSSRLVEVGRGASFFSRPGIFLRDNNLTAEPLVFR